MYYKEGPKVKCDHPRRFPAHDFLYVGLPSQKPQGPIISELKAFKFGYPRLALKEEPKVKADHTKRFPAFDFLYVGLLSQTSRTNNKRVISTFKFGYPHLTLKEGPKSQISPHQKIPSPRYPICWFTIPNL